MPFLSFSDNLLHDAYIFLFKKVLIFWGTKQKHAKTWFIIIIIII